MSFKGKILISLIKESPGRVEELTKVHALVYLIKVSFSDSYELKVCDIRMKGSISLNF